MSVFSLPQKKHSIIQTGQATLNIEIQGLQTLCASLDKSFEQAVDLLMGTQGQIIVTGMGKSGHIARKIAATLCSTGTRALFMHPAEASHGDLGMIAEQDTILALSNSGETRELSDIIAYSHRHGIPLIAMTFKKNSTLAKQSSCVLLLPKITEACPNKLAPTTSTTMMLALGDALAMSLLELKGFSAKDFKEFHPGGKLGQLLARVADLMSPPDLTPLVGLETPFPEVILAMTQFRLGCVGVVDDKGHLVGIITDGDLRRHMSPTLYESVAKDLMTPSPHTISCDALAADAVRFMKEKKITNLFAVSKDSTPAGVIHIHDCLRAGIM